MSTDSCFILADLRERVRFLPRCLGRIKHHVLEFLNSKLLKFSVALDGVVVSYDNVRITSVPARLVDEDPHLRLDILARVLLFRPKVESLLLGTVCKVGIDHIGCLVYNCFNASIARPRNAGKDWPGKGVEEGSEISFRVTGVKQAHGVISVKGELYEDGQHAGLAGEELPKKVKKKKKARNKEEADRDEGEIEAQAEESFNMDSCKSAGSGAFLSNISSKRKRSNRAQSGDTVEPAAKRKQVRNSKKKSSRQ